MVESECYLATFSLSLNHQSPNLENEANIHFQGSDKDYMIQYVFGTTSTLPKPWENLTEG